MARAPRAGTRFSPERIPATTHTAVPLTRSSSEYRPLRLGARSEPDAPRLTEAQKAEKHAADEGYAAGLEQGRAQAMSEAAEHLERLQASAAGAVQMRAALAETYRREVIELALCAAQALVQAELERGPELVQGLIEQALEALTAPESLHLTVSEDDAARLGPWLEGLAKTGNTPTVVVDEEMQRGDVRVRSPAGSVEALMNERLALVRKLVLGELAEGEDSA